MKKFLVGLILVSILFLGYAYAAPRAVKTCNDGMDNDGDGLIDFPEDPGCSNKNDMTETNPDVQCDDGIDNDGDSAIDMSDAGCASLTDNDESNCGDGVCEGSETSENCVADCGEPDSCSDTDGGYYPYTFGTTSGYYNNNPYSNDDSCYDSDILYEYYCSGNYEYFSAHHCGNDTFSPPYCSGDLVYKNLTDNYCANGVCNINITQQFQENCNDYDGYSSNYCDNYDNIWRNHSNYFCSDGICDFTVTPEFVEWCPYGCEDGECLNPIQDSCSDTDSGFVIETLGTVSGYLNQTQYEYDDYCINNATVMEYFCNGDYSSSNSATCITNATSACYNGACV